MNYELYMADAMIARDHDRSLLDGDPTAHAVMLTIRAAARKLETRRLSDVTIFTTLEPCPMCMGALLEAQVRALVFAVPDEVRGSAGTVMQMARSDAMPHQISVVSGVRESEAGAGRDPAHESHDPQPARGAARVATAYGARSCHIGIRCGLGLALVSLRSPPSRSIIFGTPRREVPVGEAVRVRPLPPKRRVRGSFRRFTGAG